MSAKLTGWMICLFVVFGPNASRLVGFKNNNLRLSLSQIHNHVTLYFVLTYSAQYCMIGCRCGYFTVDCQYGPIVKMTDKSYKVIFEGMS